jgi:hypothetical protein
MISMKYSRSPAFATNYLRVTAVVTALIGVSLLFQPDVILQRFIPGATGDFFVRFIGSALLGYSTLNWLASGSNDLKTYRIALDANLVTLSIATILSIAGVASGTIENLGWLLIAEHMVFTAFFAWARLTIK